MIFKLKYLVFCTQKCMCGSAQVCKIIQMSLIQKDISMHNASVYQSKARLVFNESPLLEWHCFCFHLNAMGVSKPVFFFSFLIMHHLRPDFPFAVCAMKYFDFWCRMCAPRGCTVSGRKIKLCSLCCLAAVGQYIPHTAFKSLVLWK